MSPLLQNAVSSIRMGIEDYNQQDSDRAASAIRNFYAGVLLLAKCALIEAAPEADPMLVIAGKVEPVADGNGGIEMRQQGHTTVDFNQIQRRAKNLGVEIDGAALKSLNRIRNDVEHHYTTESLAAVRQAISEGFPVVASLFRQIGEDPAVLLPNEWNAMLMVKDLFDRELAAAKATFSNVDWHASVTSDLIFKCPDCTSKLIEQQDPDNKTQDFIELKCRACAEEPEVSNVIENAVEDHFGIDAYIQAKEGGEPGPIHECPSCQRDTLLDFEDKCLNCGEEMDFSSECMRCSNDISLADYLEGLDSGLCSYCTHIVDKIMSE